MNLGSAAERLEPELLAELCYRAPDAVGVIERPRDSEAFVFRYINAAFERLYGCRRAETLGTPSATFIALRATPEDLARVQRALEVGEPFRVRRGMHRPDETFFWVEVNFQPIPWDQGDRWMFITRDVSREKNEHERVVQLSAAVEQGYEPVAISIAVDGRWVFSYINDAFTRATGYVLEDLAGKTWDVLLGDENERPRLETMRAALHAGQQVRTEISYRTKDGRDGIFEVHIQPLRESSTKTYASIVSVFHDITESRARERKLQFEAEHDPLTGLYNRRYLERVLGTAIAMTRSAPSHALLFADLDGFKQVNDRLGHDAGDRVLVATARAFEASAFQTDAVGRWGGDEFAVLLYHCSLANAKRTAEDVLAAFHASPDRQGTTISIGVVSIQPGETVSDLVRRADQLCYRAKAAGRGRVLAEPERTDRIG